jgi:hypothetical protein
VNEIKLRFHCKEHGFVGCGFGEPITEVHFNQRGELGLACPLCFKSRPMTLQLWTGLHDKLHVPIYVGDILATDNDGSDGADKWNTETMGVVGWDNQFACFTGLPDDDDDSIYSLQYVKVVGTIYDKPPILGEKNVKS